MIFEETVIISQVQTMIVVMVQIIKASGDENEDSISNFLSRIL